MRKKVQSSRKVDSKLDAIKNFMQFHHFLTQKMDFSITWWDFENFFSADILRITSTTTYIGLFKFKYLQTQDSNLTRGCGIIHRCVAPQFDRIKIFPCIIAVPKLLLPCANSTNSIFQIFNDYKIAIIESVLMSSATVRCQRIMIDQNFLTYLLTLFLNSIIQGLFSFHFSIIK